MFVIVIMLLVVPIQVAMIPILKDYTGLRERVNVEAKTKPGSTEGNDSPWVHSGFVLSLDRRRQRGLLG